MSDAEKPKHKRLEEITNQVRERYGELEAAFAGKFYHRLPESELAACDVDSKVQLVAGFYEFMRQRRSAEVKLRIFNPTMAREGWQSTHTIIEIVNDDMPFLVDSVLLALSRFDLSAHLIIHPVIRLQRDQGGYYLGLTGETDEAMPPESMMHLQVDRLTQPEILARLEKQIRSVLVDVRLAVTDWKAMCKRALEISEELSEGFSRLDEEALQEAREFFQWLASDHFTFLGFRDYEIVGDGDERILKPVEDSGLGLMRESHRAAPARPLNELAGNVLEGLDKIHPIIITKTNGRSTVHRDGYMDYISILRFDSSGTVCGERRIIGMFTSGAYIRRCQDTPLVRRKVLKVMSLSGLKPGSHAGKALLHILETLPRDELFQASSEELLELGLGILDLQERSQTRLFIRRERFGRFYSCMVFIPRDRFNTENRQKIQSILKRALKGERLDFAVQVGESKLARMHVIVRQKSGRSSRFDVGEIEIKIKDAIRSWDDELGELLVHEYGEERGLELLRRFGKAFPVSYMDDVAPHVASYDVASADALEHADDLKMSLYRSRRRAASGLVRFKIFKYGKPIPLSDVVPMLENLGMRIVSERPYELRLEESDSIWIQDFDMQPPDGESLQLDLVRELFQEAFEQTYRGHNENDGFNRLVMRAKLEWRQIAVLRACAKYLLQTGVPFSQTYMEQTLASAPLVARLLVEYFEARFDPLRRGESKSSRKQARKVLQSHCSALAEALDDAVLAELIEEVYEARESESVEDDALVIRKAVLRALDGVSNADEDRILRGFADVIQAMLRTNYFQVDGRGQHHEVISFKLDSGRLPELPKPRPFREIWVYSPRVEGVHLRGGKVARGGLRWSDRREDFRTEVLGLLKAQTVKNTIIVPVGAKGGFFVKHPPDGSDREALLAEGVHCYRSFIQGLLDLTDNLDGEAVVSPKGLVRHDEDDPYLVVAADKGTASFSDIANSISAEYGFWLDDAFASGGSNGYDHKKMGITAKGAWESVKRHFREIGIDIQTNDFTVVGIGDMAGDVFGNGMLLSRHIRLQAAFNHMHIFIDPDPDAAASFSERERLFNLPRSSWTDYDESLISEGGGIYSRQAKSIPISPQVRDWLGIEADELSPQALIRELLTAPVDLFWNGGIGTYVKAEQQTHIDVGDLANNAVRVNGRELRCKVVGEGGNLGFTQRGRIEFALNGGRINTDFIDNAAGVDCSDHEVNIKILLSQAIESGQLKPEDRNQLLRDMETEVEELVLRSNYLQTQALTMMESLTSARLGAEAHFIAMLERQGIADRDLDDLPDEEELRERVARGWGLTRPELAMLFSYSKIMLYQDLIESNVPEDPYLSRELEDYFPRQLRERFSGLMGEHKLWREIIATRVANSMVNRMGAHFALRIKEDTGASPATVAKAFTVAREIFEARSIWGSVEALDNKVPQPEQNRVFRETWNVLRQVTRRLITLPGGHAIDISSKVERFAPGIREYCSCLEKILPAEDSQRLEERFQNLVRSGFPEDIARRIAMLGWLYPALDIVDEARNLELSVDRVGKVYFEILDQLCLRWLREQVESLPVERAWHAHARGNLRDELYGHHRVLARRVLAEFGESEHPISAWFEAHADHVSRTRLMLEEMRHTESQDFASLQVAVHGLGQLVVSASG